MLHTQRVPETSKLIQGFVQHKVNSFNKDLKACFSLVIVCLY